MEEGLKNLPPSVSSNTEKQEEKLDDTTQQNVDNNDVTKNLTNDVTFMDLIPDVRRIVFKNLDFGSKYNLSLIWKDMAGDFWRNVDVEKRWSKIKNLEDLVYAGVLASAGIITQVDKLILSQVDVSSIPVNIINSLAKIVPFIYLTAVRGWRTSMLNDAKCMILFIRDMNLDSSADKRPIKVLKNVWLENVTGDLDGLMERLTYEPVDQISRIRLTMKNMNISNVPGPLLNSLLKTFRNQIDLREISGISSQLMSGINCKILEFTDFEFKEDPEAEDIGLNMNSDIEELCLVNVSGNLFSLFENINHCPNLVLSGIESSLLTNINMAEVLKDKVESLRLELGSLPLPDWLQQYDGDGICVRIVIPTCMDDESHDSWAVERGWKVEKRVSFSILSRPE